MLEQVLDVAPCAGEKIIEANNFRTLRQQAFA
jgi:hypothetical protein